MSALLVMVSFSGILLGFLLLGEGVNKRVQFASVVALAVSVGVTAVVVAVAPGYIVIPYVMWMLLVVFLAVAIGWYAAYAAYAAK